MKHTEKLHYKTVVAKKNAEHRLMLTTGQEGPCIILSWNLIPKMSY